MTWAVAGSFFTLRAGASGIWTGRFQPPRRVHRACALEDNKKVGLSTDAAEQTDTPSTSGITASQVLIAAVGGFGLIAFDVFSDDSLHILRSIDVGLHEWVIAHIPPATRKLAFGKVVSDVFIVPELIMWPIMWILMLQSSLVEGGAAILLSVLGYIMGGPVKHGDAVLVNALKLGFHRSRPGDIHRTFSFPSGHTTAAILLTGTILYMFLPILLESHGKEDSENGETEETVGSRLASVGSEVSKFAPMIMGAAYLTTAVGRIGADAHWLSDTAAAAFLGVAIVASMRLSLDEAVKQNRK